jgi:adenylyltransferase/sulfurtransferase
MKTVTIVGLGALGSHVLLFGRNWSTGLRVIDFDSVESKNTQAQFHTKMGLGKNKAMSMQAAMRGMFGVKIGAFSAKLGATNDRQLLAESAVVVDCTDNAAARLIIQDYCSYTRTPCLHGCLSADGQFARVIWTDDFVPDKESEEGEATCVDGRNLPFHAMAGAVIAQTVQTFLETGKKQGWQLTPTSLIRLT